MTTCRTLIDKNTNVKLHLTHLKKTVSVCLFTVRVVPWGVSYFLPELPCTHFPSLCSYLGTGFLSCDNWLKRQLGTLNTSIFLTTIDSDSVDLSSTLSQEWLICMLLTLALHVHLRARRAALFCASCSFSRYLFCRTWLDNCLVACDVKTNQSISLSQTDLPVFTTMQSIQFTI